MKKIFEVIFILFLLTLLAGCAGALHSAAAKGNIKALKEMLDGGANINESSFSAMVAGPPLHYASYYCQVEAVRLLLERGADVNAAGWKGMTARDWAAEGGCNKLVKLLEIESGADEAKTQIATNRDRAQSAKVKSVSVGAVPSKEVSPIIKSDVDELPSTATKPNKNSYAIVIGIENYRQKLPKADFASHDAKIISEYLTKIMGYPEENVITLLNDRALKSDMEKYFDRWLNNNVEENGRVFIYYSGHGAPNTKTGDAYLVPYDGDPTFIAETGYPISRLYESLGKLKAREITVVLDSCFSGAGGRSVLAKGAKPLVITINTPNIKKNIAVMTASSGDQISSAYEEQGHGLFTYFMLKGIKNEDVVKPDGSIKMDDLFSYIKPQVERIARKQYNNEQTPQLIGAKKN
ncbi:MAG: caspase family protein [Deltaproteobacteria bacterium]